jgi:hypothetical protein
MRGERDGEFQTYHLTCPVCGALPGTTCIGDAYQELPEVHPSRRVSIAERNRRWSADGWEPPELAERDRERLAAERARAPLFDPRLGPGALPR